MEDMLKNNALELCQDLIDRKAGKVVCMEMSKICSWTSLLIIATVSSHVHMHSLSTEISEKIRSMGMDASMAKRRIDSQNRLWNMIDCGEIVVSLMGKDQREFYSLEDLWYEARIIYQEQ